MLAEFDAVRLDELVAMWRASFEAGLGVTDPHPIAAQKDYFVTQVLPRNSLRVALQDENVVGFIAASRDSIAQLYVRIGYQRRGIGRQLLEWAKAQSGGSLWLYTFARNQAAQRFYEREGFRVVARGFEPIWQLEDIKYEWTRSNSL